MQFDFLEFSGGETHYSSEIGELGGHVIKSHWSQSPAHLISTIKEMRRLIGENGPYDAVHSHLNFRSAWVLLAARLAGVPIRVAHSHTGGTRQNDPLQMLYRAAMRHLILRHSTALVACSTDAGCFVFGKRQFLARGKVIPNAVDLSVFHPAEEVDARSLETMPKGPRRIVSVEVLNR